MPRPRPLRKILPMPSPKSQIPLDPSPQPFHLRKSLFTTHTTPKIYPTLRSDLHPPPTFLCIHQQTSGNHPNLISKAQVIPIISHTHRNPFPEGCPSPQNFPTPHQTSQTHPPAPMHTNLLQNLEIWHHCTLDYMLQHSPTLPQIWEQVQIIPLTPYILPMTKGLSFPANFPMPHQRLQI